MIRMLRAELRDSWTAWLGVSLTFLASNFTLALTALARHSAAADTHAGLLSERATRAYYSVADANMLLPSATAMFLIAAATGLVVNSRRTALARLGLTGATPLQIVGALTAQVAAVSLASAVVADALACICLRPALNYLAGNYDFAPAEPHISALPLVTANLICVAISLLGALWQTFTASRIPPVEAVRTAQGIARQRRVLNAVLAVLAVAVMAVAWVASLQKSAAASDEAFFETTLQSALMIMPIAGLALALAAPFMISGVTRAWTALMPTRSSAWMLARSTVIARGERLGRTIVPMMFAIGLPFGMLGVAGTFTASLNASSNGWHVSDPSLGALLLLVGLPMVIAIASAVGGLIMLSRQREAEVALGGVLGATPRQQACIPILEGLILTGTATMLGCVIAMTGAGFMGMALSRRLTDVVIDMPWLVGLAIAAIAAAVATCATTLPTLPSLRRPAPSVIARLVAA